MPMCPVKNLIKNAFIIYHKFIEKKIIIWKLKIAVKHDFLLVKFQGNVLIINFSLITS